MSDVLKKDKNFVPAVLTDSKGKKQSVFLYKPQNLIITGYTTTEMARYLGMEIEEDKK